MAKNFSQKSRSLRKKVNFEYDQEIAVLFSRVEILFHNLDQIFDANQTFYFSDGHATENFTRFYDKSKVRDLPNILDWNAIKKGYWGGDENLTVKHKKQAEFLLLGDLPPDFIIGYACFNDFAKMELQKMGIEEEKIKVFPKGYY